MAGHHDIDPMTFIPRSDEAPPVDKYWETNSLAQHKNDPLCSSTGCTRPVTMGLDYEPYNDFNHIPYAGQPGHNSPMTFIPRADKPPHVVSWADTHSEFMRAPWV